MLGLIQFLLALIIFISRYEFLIKEIFITLEIRLSLFQVNICQANTHLCRAQLSHIRDYLHFSNHIASIYMITWLFVEFCDDTRNLRFNINFITRFNLTCNNGRLLDVLLLRSKLVVYDFLGLAFLPKEHECSDENQRDNCGDNQFAVLFHILNFNS